jgi:phosphoglycerate dehydrogenase-like enzyme
MTKVLLIDPALAGHIEAFRAKLPGDVDVASVTTFDDGELEELAIDARIFVNARRPITRAVLAMAPRLELIQAIGVGTDTIDRDAVAASGVQAAYNPGVNRVGAAEHTVMLMLALVKRIGFTERQTRSGRFVPAEIITTGIDDLADATIGLVGMGAIGQAVVERLMAFGPRIVYHARHPVEGLEDRSWARRVDLDELLASSDIVSLHVPLTGETYHLIGAAELARMPRGAYLIDMGRGGLVDEAALRVAIDDHHLAGAALDVLEHETDGANPFSDVPEVIVTPHIGGGSRHSMANVVERCAANIRRFLAGEPLHDRIV